jgi:heme A synthase
MTTDQGRDFLHGIIGTIAPAVGFVTSFQEQLEWGMRMTSLFIGIIVGLLSLLKLIKKR